MSSMGESYDAIKAGVQDKVGQDCLRTFTYISVQPQVPDVVTAKVTDAKGQVRFGKTLIALV